MPNTYCQISYQFVFAVKYREALILPEFRNRLHQYIFNIFLNQKQRPFVVGGTGDHIHIFAGLDVSIYIPDLIRDVKSDSSLFINQNNLSPKHFRWQEGYGAFTYSMRDKQRVINYILNQEEHHRKRTFRDEYKNLLNEMDVSYNERYLFDFFS